MTTVSEVLGAWLNHPATRRQAILDWWGTEYLCNLFESDLKSGISCTRASAEARLWTPR
jgi:hypothetical protein